MTHPADAAPLLAYPDPADALSADHLDLAADLDFVSWDNYRRMQWTFFPEVNPSDAALAHAAMRGLKQKNFWVMEQQAGSGGWQIVSVAPRPGTRSASGTGSDR